MEGEHVLEFLKAMQKGLETQMDSLASKMDKDRDEMKANLHQMKREIIDAWLTEMKDWRRELMVCQETMEANPETTEACQDMTEACQEVKELSPEEMESEVERREIPTEVAAVKSSRTMKKRYRGRRKSAGRRGKPKELTRSDCGSRGLLAAACRKVSRRATVAWCKRYVSRKIRTQDNCRPWSTLRSKVARRKVKVVREGRTKHSVAPRTQRGCTCRMKRWKDPSCVFRIQNQEGKNGIRNRGLRQQLQSKRESTKIYRKNTGLEIIKEIARSLVALRKVQDWTRWKGRPPPKRKKRRQIEQEPVM
jgi:hypothetical protein